MPKLDDFSFEPYNMDHANLTLKWRNRDDVRKYMYDDRIIKIDDHLRWTESIIANDKCDYQILHFKNQPIGSCALVNYNSYHNFGYLAYYLGEENLPIGIGAILEWMAFDYFLTQKGVRKVIAEVLDINQKVIAMHKKFGCVEEGILRAHWIRDGETHDTIILAMFREIWDKKSDMMRNLLFK